jgi:hypothetical protein
MKDHSIFQGIKELRGGKGNFRIENEHYYKEENGIFIHAGTLDNGYKKLSNKRIYEILTRRAGQ